MIKSKFICVLSLFSALVSAQTLPSDKCPPPSKDINERVENYLAQRLVSGNGVRPSVKSVEILSESCYRKLTMTVPGTNADFVMYLSSDERFLTSTLYDLSVDPQKEVAHIAANVEKLLMRDDSPRLGKPDSSITLVEFVDFQCPYCKRFADWYSNLPESLRAQTTIIFKNLPFPPHQWSRAAASYAVCANFQSPSAFRTLTDLLFQKQSEITPENLKENIATALKQFTAIDIQQLETCASGKEGSEIVERDIAVARQLNVNTTPTLFINGRRVLRVGSLEELQHLLENELANTVKPPSAQISANH